MKLNTWTPVKGFEGFYEINQIGEIRSWSFGRWRKRANPFPIKWRISKDGYAKVILSKGQNEKAWNSSVHRLVATHFLPNPLNLAEVNHKDGNKLNNSVENLEWVSRRQNMQHAFKLGLNVSKRGHFGRHAKLTIEQVDEIKRLIKEPNSSASRIAKQFGISAVHVYRIRDNVHWKPMVTMPCSD